MDPLLALAQRHAGGKEGLARKVREEEEEEGGISGCQDGVSDLATESQLQTRCPSRRSFLVGEKEGLHGVGKAYSSAPQH